MLSGTCCSPAQADAGVCNHAACSRKRLTGSLLMLNTLGDCSGCPQDQQAKNPESSALSVNGWFQVLEGLAQAMGLQDKDNASPVLLIASPFKTGDTTKDKISIEMEFILSTVHHVIGLLFGGRSTKRQRERQRASLLLLPHLKHLLLHLSLSLPRKLLLMTPQLPPRLPHQLPLQLPLPRRTSLPRKNPKHRLRLTLRMLLR